MELEPLRRIGYALDVATLQQVAYNHGIEMSIANMTQAQKAQLRYIAIIEQSNNAMGDMARTIDSPANQLRILESRIQTLKRAIGDSLMPVISAALPYVTAFVQILGETFRSIAEFMGFELPVFDYSDLMTKQNEDIANSFDDATAASNKFKGTLAGIDQLNIIGSKSETSGGAGDLFGDLNLDLPSYDFLGNLQEETSKAYETLKKFLSDIAPIVAGIAATLGALFAVDKISSGLKAIAEGFKFLTQTPLGKVAATIGATVGAFLGFKKVVKDLTTGNGSLGKLALAIGGVVAAATVFIATGNPLGAILTVLGAGIGALVGHLSGIQEMAKQAAMEKIAAAFESGVTPISEVADALERVSIDLTSSETQYLNTKESLKSISENAKIAGTEIQTMISELKGGGTLSEEEINKMKKAFEELAEASKQYIEESNNNFKLYILANQDMLKAQGFNVSSMVELINKGTQNAEASIESLSKRAQELSDLQMTVGLNTDQLLELETINEQLLKMSGVEVDFGVDISGAQNALENLSSLKFDDPTTAAENIQRAVDIISDAYSKLDLARTELMKDVDLAVITGDLSESDAKMLRDAVDYIIEARQRQLDEVFSEPLRQILYEAQAKGYYAEAQAALSTSQGIKGSALSGIFNKDVMSAFWSGKSIEDINKEKAREMLGGEEISRYFENPFDVAASMFAQKGLSKDVLDRVLSNGQEMGENQVEGIVEGVKLKAPFFAKIMELVAQNGENTFSSATESSYMTLGGSLMNDLAMGILNGKPSVLSAIDDVANAMYEKMSKLNASMSLSTEESGTPNFGPLNKVYSMLQTASAVKHSGVDSQVVGDAGRALADNGVPININMSVQSYVELDGEQVGQATAQYQQRQMAYSNGRN